MKRTHSWSSEDIRNEIKAQNRTLCRFEDQLQLHGDGNDLMCPKCAEYIEELDGVVQMICSERFVHTECALEEYCEEHQTTCLFCCHSMAPDHIQSQLSD